MDTSEFSHDSVIEIPSGQTAAPQLHHFSNPAIRLSWIPVSWATSYAIQVANSNSFNAPTLVYDVEVDMTSLEFTWNATSKGQYFWRVGAKAANGTIEWSPTESLF